jgi:hypothetical protein
MSPDLQIDPMTPPGPARARYVLEILREALGCGPLPLRYTAGPRLEPGRIAVWADPVLSLAPIGPGNLLPPLRTVWDDTGRELVVVGGLASTSTRPSGARVR